MDTRRVVDCDAEITADVAEVDKDGTAQFFEVLDDSEKMGMDIRHDGEVVTAVLDKDDMQNALDNLE